jgi:hypothetical protein
MCDVGHIALQRFACPARLLSASVTDIVKQETGKASKPPVHRE